MTKRFLIGQLGKFGDCLYATTLAKQIKHDFPESHITWAIMPKYKSILDLNPHIDDIWEVDADDSNYDKSGWEKFESEALQRKEKGDFDEVILSQIPPLNWINFTGTIRGTILSAYKNPITVSVEPIVKLSQTEIANVKNFAEKHNLHQFENVILFECTPGSYQSKVNLDFALEISREIISKNENVCFVISTAEKLAVENRQIIDASELSFRENVELTKLCTLLIGCSSGISWLSTSKNAKKLPTIQLLDAQYVIYTGMHFDFQINQLDNNHILEMVDFDKIKVISCVEEVMSNGLKATKAIYQQEYKPNFLHLKNLTKSLIGSKNQSSMISEFTRNYIVINDKQNNKISESTSFLCFYMKLYGLFYRYIQSSESGFFYVLRKVIKTILWKKLH
jgi:ADP-heptose:LPS heptosyltransferase